MINADEKELKDSELSYSIFLVLYYVLVAILFYCILTFCFRHTYQLPVASPGTLVSDWWTWSFVREWLMVVYLLVFISGPFMRLARNRLGAGLHIFLLFVLLVWWVVNLSFDIVQLTRANLAPTEVNFDVTNLARDPRWCCVYGGQPGTALVCAINVMVAACPAIGVSQLTWNWVFVMRFIVHILIGVFLIYDMIVMWTAYLPVLNKYLLKNKAT